MKNFLKGLVYDSGSGTPSLTSTMAFTAFLFFILVTVYLVVTGKDFTAYSTFASVTAGGGLLAQVGGKCINNFSNKK